MFRSDKGKKKKVSFYDQYTQNLTFAEQQKRLFERADKIMNASFEERRLIGVCYILEYYFYNLKFPFIGNIVSHNGLEKPYVESLLKEIEEVVLYTKEVRSVGGRPYDRSSLSKNLRNYQLNGEWLNNSRKKNKFFFDAFEVVKEYVERYAN